MIHDRVRFLEPQRSTNTEVAGPQNWGAQALQDLFGHIHPGLHRQFEQNTPSWENLAQETHPGLFAEDLMGLLRHQEREGDGALARQAYQWISQKDEIPGVYRQQAEARLALLEGRAPWPQQVEQFSQNFIHEVTRPELIVGMGVGSLGYGMGRVLGASGARALGLGSRLRLASGGVMGLGLEVTAFTTASLGISQALHPEQVNFQRDFSHHWNSALMMLGILRGVHWAAGAFLGPLPVNASLGRRIFHGGAQHGATYVGLLGSAYGHQALGWAPPESLDQVAASTLAQLLIFHAAGRLSRELWHPHVGPLERSLHQEALRFVMPEQSALAWSHAGAGERLPSNPNLVFNENNGGRGQGPKDGESSRPPRRRREPTLPFITLGDKAGSDPRQAHGILDVMRRIIDPQYKFYEQLVNGDIQFEMQGPLTTQEASLNRLLNALNGLNAPNHLSQNAIPLGRSVVLVWPVSEAAPQGRNLQFIKGERGFTLDPFNAPSADHPTPPPPVRTRHLSDPSLPRFGPESTQHRAESAHQLIRHIMQDKAKFQQRLIDNNLAISLDTDIGFNLPGFLTILNGLPRLSEIPSMRRINFSMVSEGGKRSDATAIKLDEWFVNPVKATEIHRPHRTPEAVGQVDHVGPIPSRIQTPGSVAKPETPPPSSRETTGTSNVAWTPGHLPVPLTGLEQFPLHLRLMPQMEQTGQRPALILEGRTVQFEELSQLSQERMSGLRQGSEWDLWIPRNPQGQRAYRAQAQGESLVWKVVEDARLERIEGQALFQKPIVRSPLETYLLLEAISRDPGRDPKSETQIQHRGWFSGDYLPALQGLMANTLARLDIPGQRITVLTEGGQRLLDFQRGQGLWRSTFQMKVTGDQVIPPQGGSDSSPPTGRTTPGGTPIRTSSSKPPAVEFQIARIQTDLLNPISLLLDPSQQVSELNILLRFSRPLSSRAIKRQKARLAQMPPGRTLVLWDTAGRQTHRLTRPDQEVEHAVEHWPTGRPSSPLRVESALELLQRLAAAPETLAPWQEASLQVMAGGKWTPGNLSPELIEGLNSFPNLPYRTLEIFWPAGTTRRYLERQAFGSWQEVSHRSSEE